MRTTSFLVDAAKGGDRRALENLFARYLPRVRQIVALRLGRRQHQFLEDDDVVQEILFTVFQDLERFEHKSEGSFRNWIAKCVECKIVDLARNAEAKKRGGGKVRRFGDFGTERLSDSIFPGKGPTPSQVAQAKETEEKLEAALLSLPAHYREVIILRQLCEMSYPEVAKALGFREEVSARKACSRALAKLKELMES
jgi:RNA polymerase sigma-70 factor (ECF subfamily)